MKYIKQQSTGKIVYRDQPHNEKSLDNAVLETGIVKSDLEVVESDWTDEQWTTKMNDDLPWTEKMSRSDTTLLSRTMEDMLDGMPDKSNVAQITLDKLQAKKDLRATKP
jgi:hypothetical protein